MFFSSVWGICYDPTNWKILFSINYGWFYLLKGEANDTLMTKHETQLGGSNKLFRQKIQYYILYFTIVFLKLIVIVKLIR